MSAAQKYLNKAESCARSNPAMFFPSGSTLHGIPANMSHPQMSSLPPMQHNVPTNAPPPIPPRPQSTQVSHYRAAPPVGVGSFYSYGRYPLSHSYNGYGNYGAYSCGMPRYGYSHGYPSAWGEMSDAENAFLRMAEESSRPAFQSIESLVTAVGSISMMLDSTYHAVYNSYRAVLGVVESFSRLRNHLAHILSTLALLRTFQWLVNRLLYFLRLRKTNPSVEAAWSAATAMTSNYPEVSSSQSSWPILIFLSVVFGAPWLIFRIFSKLASKKQLAGNMAENGVFYAQAMYEFNAMSPSELSIKPGQHFTVAPQSQQPRTNGWLLVVAPNNATGLVPASYVRLYRKKLVQVPRPGENTNAEMESAFQAVADEPPRAETKAEPT